MLASIHKALRSGGSLIVIDFIKHPGKSSGWVMGHVRANRERVIEEITSAGFVLIDDKPLLRVNYFLEFLRPNNNDSASYTRTPCTRCTRAGRACPVSCLAGKRSPSKPRACSYWCYSPAALLAFPYVTSQGEHVEAVDFFSGFGHEALVAVCALMIAGNGLVTYRCTRTARP
jgi:hypothetical protein